ncbi:MAG TPA: L-rhamnose/proton symporter RhaT [Luteolibacter sp.]|nr:L-rhamnose/proton symporter RhaT [Luteolibacter sp.]
MNPILGVLFHWLGGLASGSFYVPYKGVKKWSWETYWLVGGVFSWIICPWFFATLMTKDVVGVLKAQPSSTLGWTYLFGVLWGTGGLTFGLAMRYLGMSLGMGVALGYCAAFGTLLPPILKTFMPDIPVGESIVQIAGSGPGQITLVGVLVCLIGIWIAAMAGFTKEKEMPDAEKKKSIKEFNFKKGIMVATFSGIMSACFSFGLTAGEPIGKTSIEAGTDPLWSGLPSLIVVMLGGFTTNFIWCVALNIKNGSGYEYLATRLRRPAHAPGHDAIENPTDAPAEEAVRHASSASSVADDLRIPLVTNFLFSALAGATWYFQFFFYSMGHNKMGGSDPEGFGFASWTLHMASIIIFSTMWGWIFKEWKGSSKKAHLLIAAGIFTLILSTFIIGYGTYLKGGGGGH